MKKISRSLLGLCGWLPAFQPKSRWQVGEADRFTGSPIGWKLGLAVEELGRTENLMIDAGTKGRCSPTA